MYLSKNYNHFFPALNLLQDFGQDVERLFSQAQLARWPDINHGRDLVRAAIGAADVARARITEDNDGLVLTCELPGLSSDDIDLNITSERLSVRAARKTSLPEGSRCVRNERKDITFEQTWKLPKHLDSARARAKLQDGILTITLPRLSAEPERKIPIDVT